MSWKRILLFSLSFSVLVFSLLYFVLPDILYPLRRDRIPPDAYIIPWMKPIPSIEELNLHPQLPGEPPPFDIDIVMTGALKLDITFRIDIPNGPRVVPSTVYLGHDLDYLYIGGKFFGMYANPYIDPDGYILPNYLNILFDVANDGVLSTPESGSRLSCFVNNERAFMWSYHDMVWAYSSMDKRAYWYLAENYYEYSLGKAQPAFALGRAAEAYDNSTGTLIMLFSRFLRLSRNSEVNALQIRRGECWVMGFFLELGYATWISGGPADYVDGWPQKIYPYLSNDASWWPKLAIDLSNPLIEHTGKPGSPLANQEAFNNRNLFSIEIVPVQTLNFVTARYGTEYGRNKD